MDLTLGGPARLETRRRPPPPDAPSSFRLQRSAFSLQPSSFLLHPFDPRAVPYPPAPHGPPIASVAGRPAPATSVTDRRTFYSAGGIVKEWWARRPRKSTIFTSLLAGP